jgi:hypothetical protein
MKVGDLVRLKSSGELGVIVELWMRRYIPTATVCWLSSKDEANWGVPDLDDLELVK